MLALTLGCSSSDPSPAADAATDRSAGGDSAADVPVATDTGPVELLPRCEDNGDRPDTFAFASTLVGRILPSMAPVMGDPALNPSTERGELNYRARGFDQAMAAPGEARMRRTDLGDAMTMPAAMRRSLAYFVHLSDFQLADDESPGRAALPDNPSISGGMRPQEAYLPRILSATNRTLAALARPERRWDFGVITGDCADSAQLNELRWMRDIMDGQRGVRTDSGAPNDLVPGADNDPKDPFDAVAFPAPWLYVAGNHDLEVVGVFIPTADNRMTVLGDHAPLGTRDYTRRWAPVSTRETPSDMNRRLIERADLVTELRASPATPGPVGHGFAAGADVSVGANYEYDAIPGLLRVISLDTSDPAGGSDGLVKRATVTRFLTPALERADRDHVLVLLASHHATTAIDTNPGQLMAMTDPEAVPPGELEALVAAHPSVIAWLVGHNHRHRVRAVRGASAAAPGYWEIMTGAIADWPAQTRAMEIVDNGNGTLSLFGTAVDYQTANCMERRYRRLSLIDHVSGWEGVAESTAADRNVELVIPTPMSAAMTVAAAGMRAPSRIESETTLRGMR